MTDRFYISRPTLKPVANIYFLSGTYGGYGGPSDMYLGLDPNIYNSNIVRVHTSADLNLCAKELSEAIIEFNSESNLPIILVGWSQGGYTIIKAAQKIKDTVYYKKIKSMIIISSRPENTEFISKLDGIHKFIICGNLDTERRMKGSINMYNMASEPKEYIQIENGTHNYDFKECFNELFNILHTILSNQVSRFL
jgi:predicted esterase